MHISSEIVIRRDNFVDKRLILTSFVSVQNWKIEVAGQLQALHFYDD